MEIGLLLMYWGLAAYGLVRSLHVLFYLMFASLSFGTFSVLPTALVGGLTLTGGPMAAVFIILKVLLNKEGLRYVSRSAASASKLGLLAGFWVVAVLVTFLAPSLFAGDVEVIPMRSVDLGVLSFSLQNISQLGYLSVSVGLVFAASRVFRTDRYLSLFLRSVYTGAIFVVATGVVEFISLTFGLDDYFRFLRNASYAINNEARVSEFDVPRVAGFTSEAAAYGSLALSFLSVIFFLLPVYKRFGFHYKRLQALCFALILAILASTSSSSYVGLGVFVVLAGLGKLGIYIAAPSWFKTRHFVSDLVVVYGLLFLVGVYVLYAPAFVNSFLDFINLMVFRKTETGSFDERMFWTSTSWNALVDTIGLGVGVGSTRASNSVVMVLSNTGLLGGLLYYSFLLVLFNRRTHDLVGAQVVGGLKRAFFPPFFASVLAATTADFGVFMATVFGVIYAMTRQGRKLYVSNKASATL